MADADRAEPNLADDVRSLVTTAMDDVALVGDFVLIAQAVRHDGTAMTYVLAPTNLAQDRAQMLMRTAAARLDV
jgi:hypothetical protein